MRSVTRLRRNPCISSIGGRNTITATTGGRYEQEASRLQVSDLSLRPVRHECARLGIAHPHSSAKSPNTSIRCEEASYLDSYGSWLAW